MHGDNSRDTHRQNLGYVSVVAQQARPLLDPETNEQAAIQVESDRALALDLIGPHGGRGDGFKIGFVKQTDNSKASLTIEPGRYYVDGIPVDASRRAAWSAVPEDDGGAGGGAGDPDPVNWDYWDQPYAFRDLDEDDDELPPFPFLVYLRVHDRLITAVQDPRLLETALGSALPDTTARVRPDWSVLPVTFGVAPADPAVAFDEWVTKQRDLDRKMAARAQRPPHVEDDPCTVSPNAQYRGPENQFYRVQIHKGGTAADATVKWSRDNGSVVFTITDVDGVWVTLARLGRDDRLDLRIGTFVEVADDYYDGRGVVSDLLQVIEIDRLGSRVRLSAEPDAAIGRAADRHPYLRRWDHVESRRRGAPKIVGGALAIKENEWVDLDAGIQIWFEKDGTYVSHDHWRFAARTITGDIEWPRNAKAQPLLLPPDGVEYHYAPLAWILADNNVQDLRKTFDALTQ